jgi:hypothetical protein
LKLAVGLGVLFLGITLFNVMGLFKGSPAKVASNEIALKEQVKYLQDELQRKDMNIAAQEKSIRDLQESQTSLALSKITSEPSRKAYASKDPESAEDATVSALQEAIKPKSGPTGKPTGRLEEIEEVAGSTPASGSASSNSAQVAEKTPPVNFNAQEVAATVDANSGGTLSFRLVKDQPEQRFSGYLFVFVEMADQRGENKIYVYPKTAKLGEEDLPADFKDGETLSFKYNSRVELPYADIRQGASLARVSILLYGENGKIVFQRSFDRKEIKSMAAKPTPNTMEGARTKAGDKRRAL